MREKRSVELIDACLRFCSFLYFQTISITELGACLDSVNRLKNSLFKLFVCLSGALLRVLSVVTVFVVV